jgi:hypothetical protein
VSMCGTILPRYSLGVGDCVIITQKIWNTYLLDTYCYTSLLHSVQK